MEEVMDYRGNYVNQWQNCHVCRGSGEVSHFVACGTCYGSGTVRDPEPEYQQPGPRRSGRFR